MPLPRILVIDGNLAETRRRQVAAGGQPSGEGYVAVLQALRPGIHCDIVRPADAEVRLPDGVGLDAYHGVAITGSALNVYDGGVHIGRQLDFTRAVLDAGLPVFGSCWGLQLTVTVAGGLVEANPRGREFGFGRRIALTDTGRAHPMFLGKPDVFEAVTVHRDHVARLPPGAMELARNEMGLQAAAFRCGRSVVWGVQYHPEYSFGEIAATALRYGDVLVTEGLFRDREDLGRYAAELRVLDDAPADPRLVFWHGLGPAVLDPATKLAEIDNWLRTLGPDAASR
jgi:GMP synthase (glutamine-hydrolysing)